MSGSEADPPKQGVDPQSEAAEASTGSCPICRKPRVASFRPFCSKRCAALDLARWFSGAYAVPAAESDDEDDDGPI